MELKGEKGQTLHRQQLRADLKHCARQAELAVERMQAGWKEHLASLSLAEAWALDGVTKDMESAGIATRALLNTLVLMQLAEPEEK